MTEFNELAVVLMASLQPGVEKMANIWTYIGYDETQRQNRMKILTANLLQTLSKSIEEENAARLEMEARIEIQRRAIAEACCVLGQPPHFPDRGLTTCQLLNTLDAKFNQLEVEKKERCERYRSLRHKLVKIGEALGEDELKTSLRLQPFDELPADTTDAAVANGPVWIPNEKLMERLESSYDELMHIYGPLLKQYTSLQQDIIRLADDIVYEAVNEDETAFLTGGRDGAVDGAGDDQHPVVNDMVLEKLAKWRLRLVKEKARLMGTCDELRYQLSGLWQRLDKPEEEQKDFLSGAAGYKPISLAMLQTEVEVCQAKKLNNLEAYFDRLCTEADELALACCVELEADLKVCNSGAELEPVVDRLEARIDQLRAVYQRHRAIYDGIATYNALWKNLLEVEQKMKDPAILSNRGGILLKTEKEKKRLMKELQRVEVEAKANVSVFESAKGEIFRLADGRDFEEHTAKRWMDFKVSGRTGRRPTSASGRRSVAEDRGPPGAPS